MKKLYALLFTVFLACCVGQASAATLRVGIVGLVHEHVAAFLYGGQMTPAGGILSRPDVQVVGIVEPDQKLFDFYAKRFHLSASLHFKSIAEMVAAAHPQAALVFTAASDHRRVVEECAGLGLSVMMEKPLAFSYEDALAMQRSAERGHIHVLVDFETSWYPSNAEASRLMNSGALGPLVKTVIRDGHQGPQKIGVRPEFLKWLIDPNQDGDGALTDFGCYGPDLMTAMMHGEAPLSVTAVTKRLQPELYPKVDDEADIVLNYRNAVSIVEASWDWPFAVKQMDVYGRTGFAKTIDPKDLVVRREKDSEGWMATGPTLAAPYDDPLHYLEAVLSGQIQEGDSMSSLKTNVLVAEILDAARQSAQTGKTIALPLMQ
jgi:glucose-fructose oxidoreductase